MSMVRWDPFRELEDMSERLNRVFGRSPRTFGNGDTVEQGLVNRGWAPACDICETPEEYQVKAELPEVRKEDVKVSIEQGMLRIEGERKQEKEEKTKKMHRVERSYGSFFRSFAIPENVDDSKVRAEFKDGILVVHIPKSEKAKPRSIDVKIT